MGQATTCETLVRDLRDLGLRAGDLVFVHASLKRVGWIEGGAQAMIDALVRVLSPDGTLAVPTHTLSFRRVDPYDPAASPTHLGTFPNAVWRDPRARRSRHPSHSNAAIGAKAAYLMDDHDPYNALGRKSPLYRLCEAGGRILLLGVSYEVCTALHLAESLANMPYVTIPYDPSWGTVAYAKGDNGRSRGYAQREFPACSAMFGKIGAHLPAGSQRTGMVGAAEATLVDGGPLIDAAIGLLRREPDAFLCRDVACPCCGARRERMRQSRGG